MSSICVTAVADVDDASDVLEEAGLAVDKLLKPYGFVIVPVARQLPQGPSFASKYLPSKKTAAIATAAIAGLVAYESGLVGKAIDAVKGVDFAGLADKANKTLVAPIMNADYAGMAHTTGQFVSDNKVPFGVTGLIAGGHLIGHEYKKAVKYTQRQKALVNALNAVDASKVQ